MFALIFILFPEHFLNFFDIFLTIRVLLFRLINDKLLFFKLVDIIEKISNYVPTYKYTFLY